MTLNSPILFLFSKRSETTAKVFQAIRGAKPDRHFLAADGPRLGKEGESVHCRKTRATVEEMIDWPCEVQRLYRNENFGYRNAVSSTVDWYFKHIEEGIILEHDRAH